MHIKQLLMWCDMIHPYYDAVQFDFESIQHNAIQSNTMEWETNVMLFNMVQIFCFYFFGSDRQKIIS